MSAWPPVELVSSSNTLKQSYISGFLDVSGTTLLRNDVTLGKRMFLATDLSVNGNLSVNGDVSMNSRLFVNGIINQVNTNNYLIGTSGTVSTYDGSLLGRLFVQSGVFLNTTLNVTGDTTMSGNLYTGGRSVLNGDVSMNSRLFVNGDVSMNSRLYVPRISVNLPLSTNYAMSVRGSNVVAGNVLIDNSTNLINTNSNLVNTPYSATGSYTVNNVLSNNTYYTVLTWSTAGSATFTPSVTMNVGIIVVGGGGGGGGGGAQIIMGKEEAVGEFNMQL